MGIDRLGVVVGYDGDKEIRRVLLASARRPGNEAVGVNGCARRRGGQSVVQPEGVRVGLRGGVGYDERIENLHGAVGLRREHGGRVDILNDDGEAVGGADRRSAVIGDYSFKHIGAGKLA